MCARQILYLMGRADAARAGAGVAGRVVPYMSSSGGDKGRGVEQEDEARKHSGLDYRPPHCRMTVMSPQDQ